MTESAERLLIDAIVKGSENLCIECLKPIAPKTPHWKLMESGGPGPKVCVPCWDYRPAR